MKLPPGQQIFTTAYVHDGYKYVLLFLAPDLEHAREQCWRLGIDDKHELGSLECEVEMTPDGTLTRWDKDAETETDARITQLERELAEAQTAGRVLAKEVWGLAHELAAQEVEEGVERASAKEMYWIDAPVMSNPLSSAWIKQAQEEASNGN